MDRNILWLDIETTGLDLKTAKICQISIMPDFAIEPLSFYVEYAANGFESGAYVLHEKRDYSNSILCRSELDLLQRILVFLDRLVNKYNPNDKIVLAGYNILSFDTQILRNAFGRNGIKYYGSYFYSGGIDVFALACDKLRNIRGASLKLSAACKLVYIEFSEENAHGSDYDVLKTRELYHKLKENDTNE